MFASELEENEFLPAAGQGAVAMEIRSENVAAREALATINDEPTFLRITAERAFLHLLQAGCQTPVGAYTWFEDEGSTLAMSVRVFDEDQPDKEPFIAEVKGTAEEPAALAYRLMEKRG